MVESVLDGDEIIRRERENLAKLQDEWKEKLREAELEISVQRAKIAREQAELEDKLREFRAFGSPATQSESVEKPKRRWLAKLGIVDED